MEPSTDLWLREAEHRRFFARMRLAVAMEDSIDTSNWGSSDDAEERRIDWEARAPIEEHARVLRLQAEPEA